MNTKKIVTWLFFVGLIFSFCLTAVNAANRPGDFIVVKFETKLLTSPTFNSDRIKAIFPGDQLKVIEQANNNWLKVADRNGLVGYVANSWVIPKAEAAAFIKKQKKKDIEKSQRS